MIASVESLDLDVFRRYAGLSLPRHVAYPMPTWWREMGGDEVAELYAAADGHHPTQDLSLYLHVPFCETLCKFCACNRVILRHDAAGAAERVDRYVAALQQDIRRLANGTGNGPALRQVHYGGGSPTYLSDEQIGRIQATIVEAFDLAPEAEVAMEIDPRGVTPERLRCLRDVGFNRLSMGVQDFDHQVQRHVRRVQPFDMVRDVVAAARDIGFASVNFDLIYGMPYQTLQTIADAVERTIELKPDRVAFYHYAQIPEKIATQRGMDYTRLPGSEAKLAMFLEGLTRFEAAGYRFIGLDHFARPDEALFTALDDGTVQRNFQGMTTGGGLRLLGAGVSAISLLPDVGYLQNDKDIDRYVQGIETGRSPVVRGLR
ncbi:MAG: oxygen-independent coproporphyrinogen III oxidase, partial [Phycisphaerae bacterium]